MDVNWYDLFSRTEFDTTGLVQRTLLVSLESIGEKEILITKGNLLSILYDGILLPVNFESQNPFTPDSQHYVYLDENQRVWLGVVA